MAKHSSVDSLNYIAEHFVEKGLASTSLDWVITKKYKNFKSQTCRDVFCEKLRIRAILIEDLNQDSPIVIENENYEFFLKAVVNSPVYYYVPVICNTGLIYVFTPSIYFDNNKSFPAEVNSHKSLLTKKLLTLFKEDDIFSVGNDLYFAFPNTDLDDVIRKLERNQMTFNKDVFDLLDKSIFQLIIPDLSLSVFKFPSDESLTHDEVIDLIFRILSFTDSLDNEKYARIKSLLKRVKSEDFNIVRHISLGFRKEYDPKLVSIFDYEANRKKAQNLVRQIWLEKVKQI